MSSTPSPSADRLPAASLRVILLLAAVLGVLFFRSLLPGLTVFSNDGPLGALVAQSHRAPETFFGEWQDLNLIGFRGGGGAPDVTYALLSAFGPVGFSKFYAPAALLLLGLGVWCFCRQLRLAQLACVVAALAAMLNSSFFSAACWGVASHALAIGMSYFAMAALAADSPGRGWLKTIAAGAALGVGVTEGADVGAIFSICVALFAVWQAFAYQESVQGRMGGIARIVLMAGVAVLVAAQAVMVLFETQLAGGAGARSDSGSKEERWDFATQWSLPKIETLQFVMPGVFGYRMDTPDGGNYWGGVGRAPGLDRALDQYEATGRKGSPPQAPAGSWRFSGGSPYTGVFVVLVAGWAALQALRRKDSVFAPVQRRMLWFWMIAAGISILLAWGRFAPFYALLYKLPFFSSIRNPAKFTHVTNWSLIVIFAYGVHGLLQRYLPATRSLTPGFSNHLKSWWSKAGSFERKWTLGLLVAVAASLLGWLIFASSRPSFEKHLSELGFNDPALALKIASFSATQVGWFVLLLILAVCWLTLVLSGWFAGSRAQVAGILAGLLVVGDLGRANLPWIRYWNYPDKYASNPVIDLLRQAPHEKRVTIFPLERFLRFDQLPQNLRPVAEAYMQLSGFYHTEWKQQHFQYYNIQCLDVVQMPRTPEDLDAFNNALAGTPFRYWEVTSTRYLLAPAVVADMLNQRPDSTQKQFRIVQRFDLAPKPDVLQVTAYDQMTAVTNASGQFAVIEFMSALPRASLYSNWEVCADDPAALAGIRTNSLDTNVLSRLKALGTNDFLTLARLASPAFNPGQTVLLAEPLSTPRPSGGGATNPHPGSVEFSSYAPKRIVLRAKAAAPAVLLLNDKYDPNWQVTVDGKPAKVLRCNFIMRGVQLDAGDHTVEFRFTPPITFFYVSLVAVLIGLGVAGFLVFSKPAGQPGAETPAARPVAAKKQS